MTDSDQARARVDRVDHCVTLMAAGEWTPFQVTELAKEWGVSIGAVQDYAREASGIIRRVVDGDPEDIRSEIIAGIDAIRVIALKRSKTYVTKDGDVVTNPDPDCRSALAAYDLRAKMLGLVTTQIKLTAEKMTDAEIDAAIEAYRVAKDVKRG